MRGKAQTPHTTLDRVRLEDLPRGPAGTFRTLAWMAYFVRRDVRDVRLRDFALLVVRGVRGHDHRGEIETLYEYVRDRITYRKDPCAVELVSDARRTLARGAEDCDGKSTLLCTLLGCLGHRTRFVALSYRPPFFHHVYCEVQTPRGWLALDPTKETGTAGWAEAAPLKVRYEIFR